MSKRRKIEKRVQNVSNFPVSDVKTEIFQRILFFVSFEEISKLRSVCRKFDVECQKSLNCGFTKIKLFVSNSYKETRILPEQKTSRQFRELRTLKNKIEDLDFTYGHYIDENQCCFIPGKILDAFLRGWESIKHHQELPDVYDINGELDLFIAQAKRHFNSQILPQITNRVYCFARTELEHCLTKRKTKKTEHKRINLDKEKFDDLNETAEISKTSAKQNYNCGKKDHNLEDDDCKTCAHKQDSREPGMKSSDLDDDRSTFVKKKDNLEPGMKSSDLDDDTRSTFVNKKDSGEPGMKSSDLDDDDRSALVHKKNNRKPGMKSSDLDDDTRSTFVNKKDNREPDMKSSDLEDKDRSTFVHKKITREEPVIDNLAKVRKHNLRRDKDESAKFEDQKKQIEEQEKRLEEQEKRLEEHEKRLEEQEKRLEEQEKRLEEQEKRIEEQEKRIEEQNSKINAQDIIIEEQSLRILELEHNNLKMEKHIAEKMEIIEELQIKNKDLAKQNRNMVNVVAKMEKTSEQANNRKALTAITEQLEPPELRRSNRLKTKNK